MQITQSTLLNKFKNLSHCFTTKNVGNLAFHVNDDPKNVLINHNILANELKYTKETLVHMKQIHSNDVHIVNESDNFQTPQECDALVTNIKNTPLMVMVADCSPILFYDDKQNVIAVAHAGRQGAFKNIVKNTLDTMINEFNSESKNICVTIGPSIKECCYEVGDEIYEEASKINLEYSLQKKENRFYLNISKILKSQLLESGVKEDNIEISSECTCCKSKKYYSYRSDSKCGRFAGIIILK